MQWAARILIAVLFVGFFIPPSLHAIEFSSTNFVVKDPVIEPGAGFATSTSFQLWTSIGQHAIGISTTTNFGLRSGFLFFPEPAVSPPPPPPPPPPSPPPSGGGGGGGGPTPSTRVVLSGIAYPESGVNILIDGELVRTVVASNNASFSVEFPIIPGFHSFGLYSTDSNGRRSLTYTFSFSINKNVRSTISGIFIAPTIDTDRSEVRQGDVINILGQTAPSSTLSIFINSEHEIIETIQLGADGIYFLAFDTDPLGIGGHTVKSQAVLDNVLSASSQLISFTVGTKNVLRFLPGDLNKDGRVNITDFSILLFWWAQTSTEALEIADINEDGRIDLIDLSIQLFYWTG